MDTLSTLFVVILIAISGFLSGSEIALFSLSKSQLKHLREKFKTSHRTIKKLLGDPTGVLVTLLVCNEIANIAISILISEAVAENADQPWQRLITDHWLPFLPPWASQLIIGAVITTPIVLIFCEITPKVVSARTNTLVAPLIAAPLHALYIGMSPFRAGIRSLQKLSSNFFPTRKRTELISTSAMLREADFLTLVEEAEKEGTVQAGELQLIRNVFELDNTPVSEIAVPLSRIFMLSQTTSIQQALSSMKEGASGQRYSRIPVFGKNRTDIVGILYSKDLLLAKLEKSDPKSPISEIMWKPFFVSSKMHLNDLFRKMKRQRLHLALVTNDSNIPVSVVTLNDVLEALLDELLIDEEESL